MRRTRIVPSINRFEEVIGKNNVHHLHDISEPPNLINIEEAFPKTQAASWDIFGVHNIATMPRAQHLEDESGWRLVAVLRRHRIDQVLGEF